MVFENLPTLPTANILDLGCGSGAISLKMAKLGAQVTAVDRIDSVMDIARHKANERVQFITANVSDVHLPSASFDAVVLFGFVGLMSRERDAALLNRCQNWLAPGGKLLVDAPLEPSSQKSEWVKQFSDGELTFRSEYDPSSRIQHLNPTFLRHDGVLVELFDPYDADRSGDLTGVHRNIYTKPELAEMIEGAVLSVHEARHCSSEDHFLLLGTKQAY